MADLIPPRVDFTPASSFSNDVRVLRSMVFAEIKGDTQEEQLESFYITQSDLYDSYRYRMLHGRFPMICAMPAPKGGVWVDIGGGTGSNLEFFGKNLNHWSKVVVLDLCPSLVKTAQKRVDEHGWSSFVDVVQGDACDFKCPGLPPAGSVDVVTFSYALSMIPDWNKALQNAFRLLKPGGHIAVCDFTTSEKQWMGMSDFWVWLFAHDHVHLKGAHIAALQLAFEQKELEVDFGTFPYVPVCLQCPYYYFVGKKTTADCVLK